MDKRFLVSWLVLFVVWMMGDFVVHGALLNADYKALHGLFRSEDDAQVFFPLMVIAHIFLSGAFVWIYSRGVEAKPWLAQGIRFGIAVACLTVIPTYLIYHVVTPVPLVLAFKQIVLDTVRVVLMGIVLAWINK
jgi:hypothetical protein